MPNENYDATIDQKLSELYEVLKDLNTLKEKTDAVQQVVAGLSDAGKERVAEIESVMGRLGSGINKSIEIIRNVFANSTTAAKETMEKSVADTKTTLDESVAKVAEAVDAAGKARVDSMKITADAFSHTVSGLVQSANEGTARMSEIVAELRGLPLVEELHAVKTYSEKLTEEIKKVTDSIAKIDGALAEARTSVEGDVKELGKGLAEARTAVESRVEELGKSLSEGQKSVLDNLQQKFASLDALANEISAAIKDTAQNVSEKLDALSADVTTRAGNVKDQISAVEKTLCAAIAEKADSLTEENEKLSARLTELGTKIESLAEEMKAESKVNQHKISVGTWIIGALLGLLTILSLPSIIAGWKALVGS